MPYYFTFWACKLNIYEGILLFPRLNLERSCHASRVSRWNFSKERLLFRYQFRTINLTRNFLPQAGVFRFTWGICFAGPGYLFIIFLRRGGIFYDINSRVMQFIYTECTRLLGKWIAATLITSHGRSKSEYGKTFCVCFFELLRHIR